MNWKFWKKEKPKKPELVRTRIFCMGESGADSIAGQLETYGAIAEGHVHVVKNRRWVCVGVGKNTYGESLAKFKPYNKPGWVFNR